MVVGKGGEKLMWRMNLRRQSTGESTPREMAMGVPQQHKNIHQAMIIDAVYAS